MDKIPLVDLQAQYRSIKKEIDAAIQHILDTNQFIGGAPLADFERNFLIGKEYLFISIIDLSSYILLSDFFL